MNKLTELLRSPYPTLCQRWKAVAVPSLIIFLILYTLQPFGIAGIKGSKLLITLVSALITAGVSSLFTYLLPALFPSYYKEQNWTVGKYLLNTLQLLLLIAVGIWLYQSWLFGVWLNGRFFFLVLFWVMVLAPFPTVLFLLWNRNLLLARNLREATEMNGHLAKRISPEDKTISPEEKEISSEVLTFVAGTKEVLEVEAALFLSAGADGNYVKVSYYSAKDGKIVQRLIRATMKQVEDATAACPFIVRCHRAFLVNVRWVVKVDGNSQGYRLILKDGGEEIPVSRAYAKEVRTWIERKL